MKYAEHKIFCICAYGNDCDKIYEALFTFKKEKIIKTQWENIKLWI